MKKEFLKYAFFSIISMWVFSLYTMVDGFFVSKFVGKLEMSAITIVMPFINVIFSISILVSIGTATMIQMKKAKKDYQGANKLFSMSFV